MRAFRDLGDSIATSWQGHEAEDLPDIAAEALQRAALPDRVDLADVVAWVIGVDPPDFVTQRDPRAVFGEPPITVYRGPGFVIEVNLWASSTTAIHEHGFAGAFQVLHGESLESRYAFTADRRAHGFVWGALDLLDARRLQRGAIARVPPGPACTHALFHLHHPSATIVVRTDGEPRFLPQLRFEAAGIGFDSAWTSTMTPLETRQHQLAHFLARTGHEARLLDLVGQVRPLFGYHLTATLLGPLWAPLGPTVLAERVRAACARIPDVGGDLVEAALGRVHTDAIGSQRRLLTADADRLVSGVLLNAPDRGLIHRVLGPHARSELRALGQRCAAVPLPGQTQVSVLGLNAFGHLYLDGLLEEDRRPSDMIAWLKSTRDPAEVDAAGPVLAQLDRELRRASLFRAWFASED